MSWRAGVHVLYLLDPWELCVLGSADPVHVYTVSGRGGPAVAFPSGPVKMSCPDTYSEVLVKDFVERRFGAVGLVVHHVNVQGTGAVRTGAWVTSQSRTPPPSAPVASLGRFAEAPFVTVVLWLRVPHIDTFSQAVP